MKTLLARIREGIRRLFPTRGAVPPSRAALGRRGEDEAAKLLKSKGYRILQRNFRTTRGEVDLVVFRNGTVAFVEVRARTQPGMVDPLYTITRRKQRRLIKAAGQYWASQNLRREDVSLRFDVVTVMFDENGRTCSIEHVEDAFQTSPHGF